MNAWIVVLGSLTAVAAAVRSTWSPCGLSMLSTITPLAEAGRGRRYATTATWFVVGALAGGATLGLGAAAAAAVVGAFGLSATAVLVAAAVLAAVAAAADGRVAGLRTPGHIRQVNEDWLERYRAWVYGAGFGWQIGVGLATYIMTAAVYLTVALAALTGRPLVAFGICVLFGGVRGVAILLGSHITDPSSLVAFHRRFDALAEPVRRAVIGVQGTVALVAVAVAAGVATVPALLVLAAALAASAVPVLRAISRSSAQATGSSAVTPAA